MSAHRSAIRSILFVLTAACVVWFSSPCAAQEQTAQSPRLASHHNAHAARHTPRHYETIRISRPDGSVVYLRVPTRATLRTSRTPWSHQTRLKTSTPEHKSELLKRNLRASTPTRGQAEQSTLLAPDPTAEQAATASHPIAPPAMQGMRFGNRPTQHSTTESKAEVKPEPKAQSVHISRSFDDHTEITTADTLDTLVRKALTLSNPAPAENKTAVAGDGATQWRTGRGWAPGGEGNDTGAYIGPDPQAIKVLAAGIEFTDDTSVPPPTGDSDAPGYSEVAIARWDVIPYQLFSGDFEIGLLAFHMNGIDRVSISVEGGPWTDIPSMQYNPRTDVVEYVAKLSARDINLQDDELVEIRAIAYPKGTGTPRLLDTLYLYVNNHGTLTGPPIYVATSGDDSTGNGDISTPYATLKKALDTITTNPNSFESTTIIINEEGIYDIDSPSQKILNQRWITMKAADGLDRNTVIISAGNPNDLLRPKVGWLKFEGLSFDFSQSYQMYKEDADHQWYDNCRWYSSAGWTYIPPGEIAPVRNNTYSGLYVTNSLAEDTLYGFIRANIVRNCQVSKISGDAYRNSLLVINSTADNVDGTVLSHHTDLFQYFGDFENVIVYNFNASFITSTQNIFLDHDQSSFTNMAFVNFTVQNAQSNPPFSQLSSNNTHVLFFHVSNPGQSFILRDDHQSGKFVAKNVIFRNCVVERIQDATYDAPIPDGVSIDHTHFSFDDPQGIDPTVGSIAILNSQGGYFEYKGTGVSMLSQSGVEIPGLSDSTTPDRGAWPFEKKPIQ